jgi:hypothetical protein
MKLIPKNRLFPSPGTGFEISEFDPVVGAILLTPYVIIITS